MNLALEPDVPLLGVVSRLTHQKGLDLLLEIVPQLVGLPAQLVLLGSGDDSLVQGFERLMQEYPAQINVRVGFDESLSHLIEAGADIFLMPSRFEPCGLNQMYSQRYGTPPVVHATGGLKDSVVDVTAATLQSGAAAGFVFEPLSTANFFATVQRAVDTYHDKSVWRSIQKNGMAREFSWSASAHHYRAVYERVCSADKG